jgi:putative membrane protein
MSALVVCGLALASTISTAQPPAAPQQVPPAGQRPITDADFVVLAGSGGLLEVQASQLALQRSTNDHIKQFAKQTVDDHTKANHELAAILARKGMGVPRQLNANHAAILQCLSEASGQKFDTEYVGGQVASHVEACAVFETYSKTGQDPELLAWAAKTLPTLKHHKETACDLLRGQPGGRPESSQHEVGGKDRPNDAGGKDRPPARR